MKEFVSSTAILRMNAKTKLTIADPAGFAKCGCAKETKMILDSIWGVLSLQFPTGREPLPPAHADPLENTQVRQGLESPAPCHETEPSRVGDPTSRPNRPFSKLEERQLLGRISQGDSEAFWELWAIQQRRIFLICFAQMGGRHADAEDALSRVMERAREILPREALRVQDLQAWMARLTVNLCIDMHRVDKRRCQGACSIEVASCEENRRALVAASPPCPFQDLRWREVRRAITVAIAALPVRLSEAARLFFLQDLSYAQIAEELRTSNVNVRKRIQEARARLKVMLKDYAAEVGAVHSRWKDALRKSRISSP